MADAERLAGIAEQLETAARRLGDGGLSPDEATALASECAELASEAAAEADRLARSEPQDVPPGQEGLL
jgi:hypothetical protein